MRNMRPRGASSLVMVTLLVVLALPGTTAAQDRPQSLKLPTMMFGAAALADWATTYHALKNYDVREANPFLRPLDREPGKMVGLGAAIDVGLTAGWNYSVGRD